MRHKSLTNTFKTHFTKTHYNQTLQHNERDSNVHFFFPPLSDGCCDAVIFFEEEWKHTSAHCWWWLISSPSKTCKWNVWTQLSKLCSAGWERFTEGRVFEEERDTTCYFLLTFSSVAQVHLLCVWTDIYSCCLYTHVEEMRCNVITELR